RLLSTYCSFMFKQKTAGWKIKLVRLVLMTQSSHAGVQILYLTVPADRHPCSTPQLRFLIMMLSVRPPICDTGHFGITCQVVTFLHVCSRALKNYFTVHQCLWVGEGKNSWAFVRINPIIGPNIT